MKKKVSPSEEWLCGDPNVVKMDPLQQDVIFRWYHCCWRQHIKFGRKYIDRKNSSRTSSKYRSNLTSSEITCILFNIQTWKFSKNSLSLTFFNKVEECLWFWFFCMHIRDPSSKILGLFCNPFTKLFSKVPQICQLSS